MPESCVPVPKSPNLKAYSLSDDSDGSKSTKSLKSPMLEGQSEGGGQSLAYSSGVSSALLLGMDNITPLTSKDEEIGIYSDSDIASQGSMLLGERGRAHSSERRTKSKSRNNSGGGRRRSDASEKSNRSVRSSSAPREKVSLTTKIFRNLLILEESLRQQSLDQKNLRRKFTAFLAILAGAEGFTFYSLYCVPEQPSGMLKVMLQFLFFFIMITLVLFHLSGEYRRTIVIPRKFFTSTNKGIRQLNLRLVKVRTPMTDQFTDMTRALVRMLAHLLQKFQSYFGPLGKTRFGLNWSKFLRNLELRAQPRVGATDVKLVLNPRAFSSEIREAWELYRDEFWAKEGARRRHTISEEHSTSGQQNVLNKNKLLERHRKERKDRRKHRAEDSVLRMATDSMPLAK